MKPSLQYPQRLRQLLRQVAQQRSFVEIPRGATAVRSFASVRPLPDEQQHAKSLRPKTSLSSTATEQVTTLPDNVVSTSNDTYDAYVEKYLSPSEIHYTGNATMPLTSVLHIVKPGEDMPRGTWPVFRLMDENGKWRDPAFDAARKNLQSPQQGTPPAAPKATAHDLDQLRESLKEQYPFHAQEMELSQLFRESKHPYVDTASKNTLMRVHRQMVRLRELDTIFQNAQRQGRISFYMTCHGEEAIHFGSATALDPADIIYTQYREHGLLMWRGFTLEQFSNQCFSNDMDLGKGRQMPVHYGSRALNYMTISSPLGTQIPQAVGAAYHCKLQKKPNVTICFFGDGAASTIDFHSGLNFAATLNAPVLFFCRNNGYAISTPVSDQYAGDGIISRAPGYGMAAIRVDGNDVFAVHAAVREARAYALEHSAPVLIEAMTYRLGHHSTSDDSSRYRDKEEVEDVQDKSNPITRLENFLKHQQLISDSDAEDARTEEKRAVLKAMGDAERRPPPPMKELFTDVYHELTPRLKEQKAQLEEHLKKHKGKY